MGEEENTQDQGENKHTDIQKRERVSLGEIDELRQRLYSRTAPQKQRERHSLVEERTQVPISPSVQEPKLERPTEPKEVPENKEEIPRVTEDVQPLVTHNTDSMQTSNRRSSFRKAITIFGVVFFVVAVGIASAFLFWGNNNFSGNNISIKTTGPISVGGGEEFPFEITIANQNAAPIREASLFIEYPKGTKSATETNQGLPMEHIKLETIGANELVKIPLRAVMYGEEDEELEIKARIEYRVEGSNATFEKRSEPLMFRISTSPVVITFNSVDRISSGQEFEIILKVRSNSPSELNNILVKTTYPAGFDFVSADPDTISGEDTWSIDTLDPNEEQTITVTGILTGGENEVRIFDATAGVANDRDLNTIASQLAAARTEIAIEQPFLDVRMSINNSSEDTVVVNEAQAAYVNIEFTNTLETALYDGQISIEMGGNALDEFNLREVSGFYNSNNNTITWDGSSDKFLQEILPGESVAVRFLLDPKRNIGRAPEITLDVTFNGERRIFSSDAPEKLVGIVSRTIKYESVPKIDSEVLYGSGPFSNTGPVPPVAEMVTQYTYAISVDSGVNDITDAELTAIIPPYVNWLDLYQGDGTASYNATTRTMKWNIGNMDANNTKTLHVQVSLKPSLSQVGSRPTLLESQRLKAVDRFTGTTIRVDNAALTTALFNEDDDDLRDGKVQEPG